MRRRLGRVSGLVGGRVKAHSPGDDSTTVETTARAGVQPRALLMQLARPHLPGLLLALGLMLVQSVATLAQPWLGGVLTSRLVVGDAYGTLMWTLFGLIVAQATLGYMATIQLQRVSGRLVADATAEAYAHLQALPLAWHQARRRGDVLALLTGDIHRLGTYLTVTLVPLLPLLFTFIGALVLMARLAPVVAIAVGVAMPLFFVGLKTVGRRLRPLGHASMQAWADQSALAGQNLELLPLIKAFATTDAELANVRCKAEQVHATSLRQARLQGAIAPVVHVAGAGMVLLLLGFATPMVLRTDTGIGALVSVFLYGLVLIIPLSQLARVYGDTQAALGTMQRVLDMFSAVPEADTGSVETMPFDCELRFHQVGFAYPGRPALFQGFDLVVRKGETLALTGTNGAGKSTLVHLLLRLVVPQAGCISIGGIDIRDIRLATLRSGIGLVSQQVMLFNDTIGANIAYGNPHAEQADIERAARVARAHDFIAALPDGYATTIGDQGVMLSGGQKQRIALARALLKDPPILILDEATALFDPAGEVEFINECRDVLQQRTVILITHRPASLALADRVLHLDSGMLESVGVTQ